MKSGHKGKYIWVEALALMWNHRTARRLILDGFRQMHLKCKIENQSIQHGNKAETPLEPGSVWTSLSDSLIMDVTRDLKVEGTWDCRDLQQCEPLRSAARVMKDWSVIPHRWLEGPTWWKSTVLGMMSNGRQANPPSGSSRSLWGLYLLHWLFSSSP